MSPMLITVVAFLAITGLMAAVLFMGTALAMILSFDRNHSILWAIIHGLCSWFYVLYRAIWH